MTALAALDPHPDWAPPSTTMGNQVNLIAEDGDPSVLRNTALYYAAKQEPWADGMARRLRVAANDNAWRVA